MKTWIKQEIRKIRLSRKKPGLCKVVRLRFCRRRRMHKHLEMREEARRFREQIRSRKQSGLPAYVSNNSWEQELNYKLWITKGARFAAARRCEEMDSHGQWTTSLLAIYLIVVGLIPCIPLPFFKQIQPELLSFVTTALSIFLLACSLLISSRRYPVMSQAYHDCSLKIGILYDQLRQAKELEDDAEKRKEIARITREYQALLPIYPNHIPIDHDLFQNQKPQYFNLSWRQIHWRKARYYVRTRAMLDMVILIGVVSFAAFSWHIGWF